MLLHKPSSGDHIKEDGMGAACGIYGRRIDMPTIYSYFCVAEN
jgi:hypothetical protein